MEQAKKRKRVDDSLVISTKEAARLLGCGLTQVRTLAKLGKFRAFKPNRELRYFRKEVEAYLLKTQVRA
ncbi:MAG: helix-turn-helix domain-containing protein [Elusimicrobiaceae bacterium]|nr:helix-turn-helix domain-containing protein [Elusimicrobiaceae bacterium]